MATTEAWTDCHLHPLAADFSVAAAELPAVLTALGVTAPGLALLHDGPDLWDADNPVAVIGEHREPAIDDLPALLADERAAHLTLLADPTANGWDDLRQALGASRGDWQPCLLSIGWGLCSIPNGYLDATAARFHFSVAIGGPGEPAKPDQAVRVIPQLPAVEAACKRLSAALGTDCVAHLCYGEMPA
ncbi:MAG: hypothetical protein ACYTF0_01180 [Planctomycetota bacterium]|jgi:hypothetical protein